jgi:hypothetical protein
MPETQPVLTVQQVIEVVKAAAGSSGPDWTNFIALFGGAVLAAYTAFVVTNAQLRGARSLQRGERAMQRERALKSAVAEWAGAAFAYLAQKALYVGLTLQFLRGGAEVDLKLEKELETLRVRLDAATLLALTESTSADLRAKIRKATATAVMKHLPDPHPQALTLFLIDESKSVPPAYEEVTGIVDEISSHIEE